jgi:hypothetical protein
MIVSPLDILNPVFHFLDWIIAEWGVYLFLVFVWLSLIFIAWIIGGGLRRNIPDQPHSSADLGIIILQNRPPPLTPPIIIHEYDPSDDAWIKSDVL